MKKVFLFLVVCGLVSIVSAQVSFNVKGGAGVGTFYALDDLYVSPGVKVSWQVGAGMEYSFTREWALTSSLMFLSTGCKYESRVPYLFSNPRQIGIEENISTTNIYYLQLPVNAQWRTALTDDINFAIYLGPYVAIGVGGKDKDKTVLRLNDDVKESSESENGVFEDTEDQAAFKRFDFGLNYGVNMEFSNNCFVGFNMDWGLLQVHDEAKAKNINCQIMLGYRF